MRPTVTLATLSLLLAHTALAAPPVRIGVTTILSGPTADKGQSEQYGVELALNAVNAEGGVLGRPVEAVYGDNGANPAKGVAAVHRLLDEEHVPVLLGALATPVTRAILPIVQAAKVPLVIDISGGQDFVDASGVGGNPYLFKTIPSNVDIARAMVGWMKAQGVQKVAVIADDTPLTRTNGTVFAAAAKAAGMAVLDDLTIPKDGTGLDAALEKMKAAGVDHVIAMVGPSTAAFFKAYEAAKWGVPVDGRLDIAGAVAAVSPAFVAAGGLEKVTGITVFTALQQTPGVKAFVAAYRAKYGIAPTQRSFFAYESTLVVVDAIRRAGSDKAADIQAALKTSVLPSALGGTYTMDDHNHPHTPMQLVSVRDGHPAVIGTVP